MQQLNTCLYHTTIFISGGRQLLNSVKRLPKFYTADKRSCSRNIFFHSCVTLNTDLAMEHRLMRQPIQVKTNEKGETTDKEYEAYKLQTRGEYEDLMMEFEFRCRRAAMMHYHEASGYDRKVYRTEIVAAFLGTISVTSVGMWLFRSQEDISFTKLSQLGTVGILGVGAAFLVQLLAKGTTKIIPSFSKRAEIHIATAAAWQKLAQQTRSYRIQLDNPTFDVPKYAEWYEDLISQREKLGAMVSIPESTYVMYNDPEKVYRPLRQRRHMFLKFLDLEKMDADDFEMGKKKISERVY